MTHADASALAEFGGRCRYGVGDDFERVGEEAVQGCDQGEDQRGPRRVVSSYVYDPELKTYVPNPSLRPKSKVR